MCGGGGCSPGFQRMEPRLLSTNTKNEQQHFIPAHVAPERASRSRRRLSSSSIFINQPLAVPSLAIQIAIPSSPAPVPQNTGYPILMMLLSLKSDLGVLPCTPCPRRDLPFRRRARGRPLRQGLCCGLWEVHQLHSFCDAQTTTTAALSSILLPQSFFFRFVGSGGSLLAESSSPSESLRTSPCTPDDESAVTSTFRIMVNQKQ